MKNNWIIPFILAAVLMCGCSDAYVIEQSISYTDSYDEPIQEEQPVEEDEYEEDDYSDIYMKPVDSTCFSEIGYNAIEEKLYVRFLDSGSLYRYSDISSFTYNALMTADSLGGHYNKYIKGKFDSERLE